MGILVSAVTNHHDLFFIPFSTLCPRGFGSPEGSVLKTQEGGAELGWAEWEGGHRPTRSGGWDNTGKSEKLDLHKNSQSSLVGFPL